MTHQYKDHRPDSAKGKVHEVFDTKGKDAAIKKATALDIAETTARTWCSSWKNASPKKAKKAKAAAPKKANKANATAGGKKPGVKAKAKAPAKKAASKPKREKLDGAQHAAA
jgi:hypothetical protein